jgi:2-dehydro-3-deoxyphosphogalactonate aldolase
MIGLRDVLATLPLVAILRGVKPDEVDALGDVLVEEGFRCIEVPLNSPEPFDSIRRLARRLGDRALIGAGTVMTPDAVDQVADVGGRLIVMPHADTAVIRAAKARGMVCLPGAATPTEAFSAIAAGADGVKLFPAEGIPPVVVKAWLAVVPKSVPLFAVGGISPTTMAPYHAVGVAGYGLGSALYKPGIGPDALREAARAFATAHAGLKA